MNASVIFLAFIAILICASAQDDGSVGGVSAPRALPVQAAPEAEELTCGDPTLCAPRRKDIREACLAKKGIGCAIRRCESGGFSCVPRFATCENKCRGSATRTEKACALYAVLGCATNACYRRLKNGRGKAGFSCTAGPVSDFSLTNFVCLDPLTFSAFYNQGYDWPVAKIMPCRTTDSDVYVAFDCAACGQQTIANVGKALNAAGVTVAQIRADCAEAGNTASGSELFDCSGTYIQDLVTALLDCE